VLTVDAQDIFQDFGGNGQGVAMASTGNIFHNDCNRNLSFDIETIYFSKKNAINQLFMQYNHAYSTQAHSREALHVVL
jgi:hypothetical protein